MFDRYTDRARRVVYLAEGLAQAARHPQAGTGHLLLGLMYEHECSAAQALGTLGLTRDSVREAVCAVLRAAPPSPWGDNARFNPRLQTVLQDAAREAIKLGCTYVGTEHLLLSVVSGREPPVNTGGYRGTAIEALARLGIEPAAVRAAMLGVLRGYGDERPVITGGGEDQDGSRDDEVLRRLGRLEDMLREHCGEAHEIQRELGIAK